MGETPSPRERVVWLRLRDMKVFWPAVVYDTYSAATRHTHDLSALRREKGAMDAEERVVFFFGVSGEGKKGLAPNLRLCVEATNELTMFRWEGADDFDKVCRTYGIPDEIIERALKNPTFLRACEDATQFSEEAESDEEACRVFMAFIRRGLSVKQEPAGPMMLKPVAEVPDDGEKKKKKNWTEQPSEPVNKMVEAVSKISMTEELTAKCWARMLKGGWSTLVQGNGQTLYTMPGVSFSDFRPNVTVFDALENACGKFLEQWVMKEPSGEDAEELSQFFWEKMLAQGWQTMMSADDTWYTMPNTPFDRFVPDVTIFQSKQKAVAKFLQALGFGSNNEDVFSTASTNESGEGNQKSDNKVDKDVDMIDSDAQHDSECESSDETNDSDNSDDDQDDDEEDPECDGEEAEKKALDGIIKRSITAPSVRSRAISRKRPQPKHVPVAPPFKCTWGMIEQELRARGWFWKAVPFKRSSDGYIYYRSHCRDKDDADLTCGEDFFAGRIAVENYLEVTGRLKDIKDQLRREHERAFNQRIQAEERLREERLKKRILSTNKKQPADIVEISDDEVPSQNSEDDVENHRRGRARANRGHNRTPQHPTAHRDTSSRRSGSSRRKPAPDQIRRIRPSPAPGVKVSFGLVWKRLAQKGWYYRAGQFEYDYFKPHCVSKKTGRVGEDYFISKSTLETYLQESGIWETIATQIQREAIEQCDDEMEEQEELRTPLKRKKDLIEEEENTPVMAKKSKLTVSTDHDSYQTPPTSDRSKRASTELQETQDLATVSEVVSLISPESDASKSKTDAQVVPGAPLARNLAVAFTPPCGPETSEKMTKVSQPISLREVAQEAVNRLTLGYQPQVFAHRELEAQMIKEFCANCLTERRGGSMYLSGSPGCGKSALLRFMIQRIHELNAECGRSPDSVVPVHLNAMGLNDFGQLFCKLAEILTKEVITDKEEAFEKLERVTDASTKRSRTLLLVLDEIDALGKKASMEPDLCRLFELAHRTTHTFILVGIANQVDFTERHLASLRQQMPNVKPHVIVFKPYSFQTISDILKDRLGGEENAARIMNPNGIAFIARKVAAQSGDVRLALDICRRVLQQKLSEQQEITAQVPLSDIVRTIKVVMESNSKSNVSSLPRNFQMILFASTRLVALHTASASSADAANNASSNTLYDVEELYSCYCDVSHDAGVFKPLSRGEFKLGLETLSSEGMIGSAELKKQLIKLHCTPSELLQTFKNDAYFSRLI